MKNQLYEKKNYLQETEKSNKTQNCYKIEQRCQGLERRNKIISNAFKKRWTENNIILIKRYLTSNFFNFRVFRLF